MFYFGNPTERGSQLDVDFKIQNVIIDVFMN
jgi:hypothetical protein